MYDTIYDMIKIINLQTSCIIRNVNIDISAVHYNKSYVMIFLRVAKSLSVQQVIDDMLSFGKRFCFITNMPYNMLRQNVVMIFQHFYLTIQTAVQ